jgi:hypothetical protein
MRTGHSFEHRGSSCQCWGNAGKYRGGEGTSSEDFELTAKSLKKQRESSWFAGSWRDSVIKD